MAAEYICIRDEELNNQSRKIAELEAHSKFKEERINELIEDNRRIESKIDKLTETVNKVMLNSIKDDNNLNQRVHVLETKSDTQEKLLLQHEEQARKQREEDRAKTNQYLSYITVGICLLTFILTYILK